MVLSAHCDVIQQHKLHCYLQSVKGWLPRVAAFCNIKQSPVFHHHTSPAAGVGSGGDSGNNATSSAAAADEERRRRSSSGGNTLLASTTTSGGGNAKNNTSMSNMRQAMGGGGGGDSSSGSSASAHHQQQQHTAANSANDRATLKRHTLLMKYIVASLQRNAVQLFGDCIKDVRPILEICEITSGDTSVIVLSQISKFCNKLTFGMESLAGVTNNKCTYDSITNTLQYIHASSSGGGGGGSSKNSPVGGGSGGGGDVRVEDADQIYVDLSPPPSPLPTQAATGELYIPYRIAAWCVCWLCRLIGQMYPTSNLL